MNGFSILICSYNPSLPLLGRLFNAVKQLQQTEFAVEVILIDNNSTPALTTQPMVQSFLSEVSYARLLHEPVPGLTAARLAGIRASIYDWIVFFDDDNEPAPDYLLYAWDVIQKYPHVGAWGPGKVEVEYTGGATPWLDRHKIYFQQRNETIIAFAQELHWQASYPFGTGLTIQKKIADAYLYRVVNDLYTVSDRKGKELSSGGDVQLVLTGVALGKAAGVTPDMRMLHLIGTKKTEFGYLKKLLYGTASSYVVAFNQVYPLQKIPFAAITNLLCIKLCWFYFKQYQQTKDARDAVLSFINKLGEANAMYLAYCEKKKPVMLRFFEWILIR